MVIRALVRVRLQAQKIHPSHRNSRLYFPPGLTIHSVKMSPSHLTTDHDACGVGLVAQIGGAASREIADRALEALIRLAHRGGVDADGRSGDGAGMLTRIPDKLIRQQARKSGIKLPAM